MSSIIKQRSPNEPAFSNRKFLLLAITLVVLILVDISFVRVYDLVNKQFISLNDKEVLFAVITLGILAIECTLLEIIKPLLKGPLRKRAVDIVLILLVTRFTQYALGILMIYVVIQIAIDSFYSTSVLLAIVMISYAWSICILAVFIIRMLGWLKFERSATIFVLFLLASGSIATNAIVTMVNVSLRLQDRPEETRPIPTFGRIDVSKGHFDLLDRLYFITYIMSFISAWVASAFLMRYYSRKLGKFKYWIIATIPLVFFLVQFPLLFAEVNFLFGVDRFTIVGILTLIASLGKPIGGLMLAIGFWTMGMVKERGSPIKDYMVVAGFGFLLLFTSNQGISMHLGPFPPFGLATITVMGLSASLLVVGILTVSLASSAASDLRKSIKHEASSRMKLIDYMVTAADVQEIELKVEKVAKLESVKLENSTGLQNALSDAEIQEYIDEVMNEIRRNQGRE